MTVTVQTYTAGRLVSAAQLATPDDEPIDRVEQLESKLIETGVLVKEGRVTR